MSCQRYQTEALTGFPPTPELRAHVAGCAECQRAERSYSGLERLIAVAGSQALPPAGWEQRLQARLAHGPTPRQRLPLRTVGWGAAALAAALLAFFLLPGRRPAAPMLDVQTELLATGGTRAATAAVGGSWKVSADVRQEIRVWRNQQTLVLRCGAAPAEGCTGSADRRVATVPLSAPGEYRVMVLTPAAAPLPEPASFDDDARLARAQGASYAVLEPLVVY